MALIQRPCPLPSAFFSSYGVSSPRGGLPVVLVDGKSVLRNVPGRPPKRVHLANRACTCSQASAFIQRLSALSTSEARSGKRRPFPPRNNWPPRKSAPACFRLAPEKMVVPWHRRLSFSRPRQHLFRARSEKRASFSTPAPKNAPPARHRGEDHRRGWHRSRRCRGAARPPSDRESSKERELQTAPNAIGHFVLVIVQER